MGLGKKVAIYTTEGVAALALGVSEGVANSQGQQGMGPLPFVALPLVNMFVSAAYCGEKSEPYGPAVGAGVFYALDGLESATRGAASGIGTLFLEGVGYGLGYAAGKLNQ